MGRRFKKSILNPKLNFTKIAFIICNPYSHFDLFELKKFNQKKHPLGKCVNYVRYSYNSVTDS